MTDDTIQKFQLGYNPEAWDSFTKEALSAAYKKNILSKGTQYF